jgi:hypothetical protein
VQKSANFPKEYTYKNLGTETNQGLEIGLDSAVGDAMTWYANYSYQAQPVPEFPGLTATQALAEVNLPAKHRFNYGVSSSIGRVFYSMNASFVGKAFWQDVLDSRYSGETPKYAVTNIVIGTTIGATKTLQLRVNNLSNARVQQHVFGDLIKRQIALELKINLKKQ